MNTRTSVLSMILWLLFCSSALAQTIDKEPEPAAIVELGGAAARGLGDGGSSAGATAAVEVTPIERWLELETGITSLFARHSTEWDADLLFKKPCYSRSPGHSRKRWSSCLVWDPSGCIPDKTASQRIQSPVKLFSISCSGRPPNAGSAGISNPATSTILDAGTKSQSG